MNATPKGSKSARAHEGPEDARRRAARPRPSVEALDRTRDRTRRPAEPGRRARRRRPPGRRRPRPRSPDAAAEVPDWAKRAAARDTAAEMAAVPEVAPPSRADAPGPPARRRAAPRRPKAKPAAERTRRRHARLAPRDRRRPGSTSLRAAGHSQLDVSAPTERPRGRLRVPRRGHRRRRRSPRSRSPAFNASKGVMKKKNGKPKAQPTILKTRRALRLALVWAEQKGLIKKAPYRGQDLGLITDDDAAARGDLGRRFPFQGAPPR